MNVPAILELATAYILEHSPRVQAGDPTFDVGDGALVKAGLAYHAMQGTLRLEWAAKRMNDEGRSMKEGSDANLQHSTFNLQPCLVGLAIVWRDFESRLLRAAARNENIWQWQPSAPAGDCLYLALVMTSAPGALRRLAQHFANRFPTDLPEFAYRRGKLVRGYGLLKRLGSKAETSNVQRPTLNVQPEEMYV